MTSGGGATHIALTSGTLRELASKTNLIMVAGGGGGAYDDSDGANGGGMNGSGGNSGGQTTGYMFGQGQIGYGGGGGGLYGGYVNWGAGSGYIGTELLYDKKMVGNNVTTSTDVATKTESVNTSGTNKRNTPQIGNGYAKIKRVLNPQPSEDVSMYKNGSYFGSSYGDWATSKSISLSGNAGYKAVLVVCHRANLTVPSAWTFVNKTATDANWQFISIYEKIKGNSDESYTIQQASNTLLAALTMYVQPNTTITFDEKFRADVDNPATWHISAKDYCRLCVECVGYNGDTPSSSIMTFNPTPPNGIVKGSGNVHRFMGFYLDSDNQQTTITIPGLNQSTDDMRKGDMFFTYKLTTLR